MQGNIIFVCSYLCGGKTQLSKSISINLGSKISTIVEVGDFVRFILKKQTREELQGHPELKDLIIEMIKETRLSYDTIIVAGVRQPEILKAFPEAELIWIDNSPKTLYDRWVKRGEEKDNGEMTKERFYNIIEQNSTATI